MKVLVRLSLLTLLLFIAPINKAQSTIPITTSQVAKIKELLQKDPRSMSDEEIKNLEYLLNQLAQSPFRTAKMANGQPVVVQGRAKIAQYKKMKEDIARAAEDKKKADIARRLKEMAEPRTTLDFETHRKRYQDTEIAVNLALQQKPLPLIAEAKKLLADAKKTAEQELKPQIASEDNRRDYDRYINDLDGLQKPIEEAQIKSFPVAFQIATEKMVTLQNKKYMSVEEDKEITFLENSNNLVENRIVFYSIEVTQATTDGLKKIIDELINDLKTLDLYPDLAVASSPQAIDAAAKLINASLYFLQPIMDRINVLKIANIKKQTGPERKIKGDFINPKTKEKEEERTITLDLTTSQALEKMRNIIDGIDNLRDVMSAIAGQVEPIITNNATLQKLNALIKQWSPLENRLLTDIQARLIMAKRTEELGVQTGKVAKERSGLLALRAKDFKNFAKASPEKQKTLLDGYVEDFRKLVESKEEKLAKEGKKKPAEEIKGLIGLAAIMHPEVFLANKPADFPQDLEKIIKDKLISEVSGKKEVETYIKILTVLDQLLEKTNKNFSVALQKFCTTGAGKSNAPLANCLKSMQEKERTKQKEPISTKVQQGTKAIDEALNELTNLIGVPSFDTFMRYMLSSKQYGSLVNPQALEEVRELTGDIKDKVAELVSTLIHGQLIQPLRVYPKKTASESIKKLVNNLEVPVLVLLYKLREIGLVTEKPNNAIDLIEEYFQSMQPEPVEISSLPSYIEQIQKTKAALQAWVDKGACRTGLTKKMTSFKACISQKKLSEGKNEEMREGLKKIWEPLAGRIFNSHVNTRIFGTTSDEYIRQKYGVEAAKNILDLRKQAQLEMEQLLEVLWTQIIEPLKNAMAAEPETGKGKRKKTGDYTDLINETKLAIKMVLFGEMGKKGSDSIAEIGNNQLIANPTESEVFNKIYEFFNEKFQFTPPQTQEQIGPKKSTTTVQEMVEKPERSATERMGVKPPTQKESPIIGGENPEFEWREEYPEIGKGVGEEEAAKPFGVGAQPQKEEEEEVIKKPLPVIPTPKPTPKPQPGPVMERPEEIASPAFQNPQAQAKKVADEAKKKSEEMEARKKAAAAEQEGPRRSRLTTEEIDAFTKEINTFASNCLAEYFPNKDQCAKTIKDLFEKRHKLCASMDEELIAQADSPNIEQLRDNFKILRQRWDIPLIEYTAKHVADSLDVAFNKFDLINFFSSNKENGVKRTTRAGNYSWNEVFEKPRNIGKYLTKDNEKKIVDEVSTQVNKIADFLPKNSLDLGVNGNAYVQTVIQDFFTLQADAFRKKYSEDTQKNLMVSMPKINKILEMGNVNIQKALATLLEKRAGYLKMPKEPVAGKALNQLTVKIGEKLKEIPEAIAKAYPFLPSSVIKPLNETITPLTVKLPE